MTTHRALADLYDVLAPHPAAERALRDAEWARANAVAIDEELHRRGPSTWYSRIEVVAGSGVFVSPASVDTSAATFYASFGMTADDLRGRRILDIGAFSGAMSFHAEDCGAEVVALDVQSPATNGFAVVHDLRRSGVTHVTASVYDLEPELFGTFDIVVCSGVHYHLKHPLLAFERINSVTRDGGDLLVLGTAADFWLHRPDSDTAGVDLSSVTNATTARDIGVAALNEMPLLGFYRDRFLGDESNWFVPTTAALTAMLEASGFHVSRADTARIERPPFGPDFACAVVRATRLRAPSPEYGDEVYGHLRYLPGALTPTRQYVIPTHGDVFRARGTSAPAASMAPSTAPTNGCAPLRDGEPSFVSYAQNFEDVMLWRALHTVEHGFYIDIGAADPTMHSVTKAFYDHGWRGVNIEPLDGPFARLIVERPEDVNLNIAVTTSAGRARFFDVDHGGLSTTVVAAADAYRDTGHAVRSFEVETDTLAGICERYAPADIHFLKVDVEGGEQAVLDGADFSRWRPWIIVLETPELAGMVPGWHETVVAARYAYVYNDGLNRYYVAAEREAELGRHFATPAGWFDNFVTARQAELERELHSASTPAGLQRIATEASALRAELIDARTDADVQRTQVERLRAELDASTQQLFEDSRQLGWMATQRHNMALQVDEIRAEHERLQATHHQLHVAHQLLEVHNQHLEQQLSYIQHSRLWRLLRPLRAASHLARTRHRAGPG